MQVAAAVDLPDRNLVSADAPEGEPARLEALSARGFQVEYFNHARAILNVDFPAALHEIQEVLLPLQIPVELLVRSGGGEAPFTGDLRRAFKDRSWNKHNFEIRKLIDGEPRESVSHEIDHVRQFDNGVVAMEIEWNNKDPFYDRDLENFKRLHAEGAISVGVVITRGRTLQAALRSRILKFARDRGISAFDDLSPYELSPTVRQRDIIGNMIERHGDFPAAWSQSFVSDKFGAATTHWDKLEDRVHRGVGNPCPLLLIGIPQEVLSDS